ncbi:probable E3 ubiquitin-protein ligase HERC1 [Phoenix dactylifera]|uniref:Probable E3 ubiquitin-protein ligase HERC1 n=1 Tax=Phoenix dactylifera TaxID=42345 RepID=A0A8B8J7P7_PHODC|nr:probable E3 ubiquitin-protein ligase HERC1 [Phoenix dactylifera]
MDTTITTTAEAAPSTENLEIIDQPLSLLFPALQRRLQRHGLGDSVPGEFPLAANPSMVLHILTSCNFDPQDLARLEASSHVFHFPVLELAMLLLLIDLCGWLLQATCSFFKQPANFAPDFSLSLPELAALDMCLKRTIFKAMVEEEREVLKQRCGGSWKLVLKFLQAAESSTRRGKSQAIAGPGHSIAVTSSGAVYSFGDNSSGQLGLGTLENQARPQLIRSLQGIRIIQAAVGVGKTVLVSDTGRVYAFGEDNFEGEADLQNHELKLVAEPRLVESLKDIFVVQAVMGRLFTAVLSGEGRVYTLCWGAYEKLGHHTDSSDREPRPLLGPLENLPVVQIAAGYCYLVALAFQPNGLSVYTVGCGLGGKLEHGSTAHEKYPRLVAHFNTLNLQPVCLAGGSWHAAVVGRDGRVCTWGWGNCGCLGHGNEDYQALPKVVEGLSHIKAVYVAAGDSTTFVVSDAGDIYSFGYGESSNLGHIIGARGQDYSPIILTKPKLVTSLNKVTERIVQIGPTNSSSWTADVHTFVLTESGKLYAFGSGNKGQLGIEFSGQPGMKAKPERVQIDLS